MTFPSRVFRWAGIYGLIVLLPHYFLERKIGIDLPPAVTHPEYFYGFIGVAVAWQIAFLIIAKDPVRFRPLMIPSIAEKLLFVIAAVVLFAQGRVSPLLFLPAGGDFVLSILFFIAWRRTPSRAL